jgi:NAD(P)-dependent dehydrogenase (short-subunit alcohol dehydrogenase family)
MNKIFSGKTALITGASRGIGLATAKKFVDLGAQVVMTARSAKALNQRAKEIGDADQVLAIESDVADFQSINAAVEQGLSHFGSIDILVNNAGVIDPISQLSDSDPQAWGQVVDINLKGVYHGIRAVAPLMIRQQRGTILNLSSGAANSPLEGWSHYCATKAAVKMLTQCTHLELNQYGVNTIGLSPGTVATDMMAQIKESGVNPVSQLEWSSHITPEIVATSIAYLCSSAGAAHSGEDFSIKTEEGRSLVEAAFPGTFLHG